MCGVFGVSNITVAELAVANDALHTLEHRGPDGWSHVHEQGVYMGHRRLSILDLSENGSQPMEADGVYLTVNGEIYNFKELNEELFKNHKVKFKSSSDSETLLHGYIHWGLEELLNKIEGMFAFVIYDSNSQQIHLARDHAGIKPLYYSFVDGRLAWGSELKALERFYEDAGLQYDYSAVYDFLTYKYIPSPKSLYKNVFKLPAAHSLTYDMRSKNLSKTKYWSLKPNRHIQNEDEAKALIENAVRTAVKSHLVADVPVGSFLSGGVDSSIVSYEASRCVDVLNTCSIGFDDEKVDESVYANAVAKAIGSQHKIQVTHHDFVNQNFRLMKTLFDEPFADTSAFPTFNVSALAAENMTVVLTGDGGDELFAGYNHYLDWYQKLTPWLGFLWPLRPVIQFVKNRQLGVLSRLAKKAEIFTILNPLERKVRLSGGVLKHDKIKKAFRKKYNIPNSYDDLWHFKAHDMAKLSPLSRALYLDFHTTMTDDILCKVDRCSMAHSIETRVPFLDKKVVEAAWQIDEKLLVKNRTLKYLLKKIYEGKLPNECLYRAKQGFSLGQAKSGDALDLRHKNIQQNVLENVFEIEVS